MYGFVYKTTDLTNGKIYIGQKRYGLKDTGRYLGSGKALKEQIKIKGRNSFCRDIIQNCESQEELDYMEFYWVAKERSLEEEVGYNLSFFNEVILCEKLKDIFKNENLEFLDKAILQIGKNRLGSKNNNYGNKWSDEQKLVARERTLGKYDKEDNPNYGNKWSDEQKEKASKRMVGKYTKDKNPNSKKIIRLEDGKVYNSMIEAMEDVGVGRASLYKAMKNNKKTKGWSFKFVEDVLNAEEIEENTNMVVH